LRTHRQSLSRESTEALKLLVLVPHRDARRPLRVFSNALFAAGFPGAWSFPWIAPLAILSRPFNEEELKLCAHALREQSLAGGRDGKIKSGPIALSAFPNGGLIEATAIFGPALDLAVPDSIFPAQTAGKILHRFSPFVLGAALVWPPEASPYLAPAFSFRAAALANMSYRPFFAGDGDPPDAGYSFEWKIGKLSWLPSVREKR
jgi:hypothetical protein